MQACWERVVQRAELEERVERAKDHNTRHRYKKRGIAVVPTKFGISFTARYVANEAGRAWFRTGDASGGEKGGQRRCRRKASVLLAYVVCVLVCNTANYLLLLLMLCPLLQKQLYTINT